jgi:hypothetical protein
MIDEGFKFYSRMLRQIAQTVLICDLLQTIHFSEQPNKNIFSQFVVLNRESYLLLVLMRKTRLQMYSGLFHGLFIEASISETKNKSFIIVWGI